jgi:hypothetical protein
MLLSSVGAGALPGASGGWAILPSRIALRRVIIPRGIALHAAGRIASRAGLSEGAQRRREHAPEALPLRRIQAVETQVDGAGVAPEAEGAEQPIPVGEHRAVIGVGLGPPPAVMDPVRVLARLLRKYTLRRLIYAQWRRVLGTLISGMGS